MNNSLSQSDDILIQRIKDTENLLEEINGQPNSIESKPEDESIRCEKILKVLTGLLPEIECRNGNLSPELSDKIANLVDQLTGIKKLGNEYLRNYLLRLVIINYTARHEVRTALTK